MHIWKICWRMSTKKWSTRAKNNWRQWSSKNKESSNNLGTSIQRQEGEDMYRKWNIRQCWTNDIINDDCQLLTLNYCSFSVACASWTLRRCPSRKPNIFTSADSSPSPGGYLFSKMMILIEPSSFLLPSLKTIIS